MCQGLLGCTVCRCPRLSQCYLQIWCWSGICLTWTGSRSHSRIKKNSLLTDTACDGYGQRTPHSHREGDRHVILSAHRKPRKSLQDWNSHLAIDKIMIHICKYDIPWHLAFVGPRPDHPMVGVAR